MPRCPECRNYVSPGGHGHIQKCSLRGEPVGRVRQTPTQANQARDLARRREIAARERRQARIQQMLANRRQARLAAGPVANPGRSALDNVAFHIHNAYDWRGHADECVTAVVREASGRHLVFPQRRMDVMEVYGRQHYGPLLLNFHPGCPTHHMHAEMYAIQHYLELGQDPGEHIAAIGVSKRICPMCAAVLDHLGIGYAEGWVTNIPSDHWVNPWDGLSESCKPAVPRWHPGDDESDDESDSEGGGGGRGIELTA